MSGSVDHDDDRLVVIEPARVTIDTPGLVSLCEHGSMTSKGDGVRISPTAHYTGHTWVHHGMSDRHLDTSTGWVLFHGLRPVNRTLSILGQPTVDGFLLTRHRVIDAELRAAIDDGTITQIVEVACGLSPRGLTFRREYGDRITYVEADLPEMAELKRRRLRSVGALGDRHRVETVDALVDHGPLSIEELASRLDPAEGTAIITEGLVNYFDRPTAQSMFERFATALVDFPRALYLTDVYLHDDVQNPMIRFFAMGLSAFVRGSVYVFDETPDEMVRAVQRAGFTHVDVLHGSEHPAAGRRAGDPGAAIVRIVRAIC